MLRKTFAACGYKVRAKVLQTYDHGLPQSRPRLWIVALREPQSEFRFPKALARCPELETVLDLKHVGTEVLDLSKFGPDGQNRSSKLWNEFRILDVGSSQKFSSIPRQRVCPCLTRTRCKSKGYYVPRLRRMLTVEECSLLQGVPQQVCRHLVQSLVDDPNKKRKRSPTQAENDVAGALGDGMSINVLMRVLRAALLASGLRSRLGETADFWETALNRPAHDLDTLLQQSL